VYNAESAVLNYAGEAGDDSERSTTVARGARRNARWRHAWLITLITSVAPDIIYGPGPGRNPAIFSYPAPAEHGRRIWGRIWPYFDNLLHCL